jgi:hypothetical protein
MSATWLQSPHLTDVIPQNRGSHCKQFNGMMTVKRGDWSQIAGQYQGTGDTVHSGTFQNIL